MIRTIVTYPVSTTRSFLVIENTSGNHFQVRYSQSDGEQVLAIFPRQDDAEACARALWRTLIAHVEAKEGAYVL